MFEKRRSVRTPIDEPIQIRVDGKAGQPARIVDISEEGVGLRFDGGLDTGVTVYLEADFLTPDFSEEPVPVKAEVMHQIKEPGSEAWQIGLKIEDLQESTKRALKSHLDSIR